MQEVADQHKVGRTTLRHIKALLSGVINHAKQQGYFDGANPVHGVEIPKARPAGETPAYTLEQVIQMVTALSQPAATIAATAAFTGLRRGELEGLLWENYIGKEIRVTRSVWNGHADDPKTSKSKAPVPVIAPLRRMLDAYSASCGHPVSGAMFASKVGKPLCLNNLTNRQIQPRFEYCQSCGQIRFGHGNEHPFQLDQTRTAWHGWHAFRRGLGSNLYRLGVPEKTIQAILRHANVSTTNTYYIKTVPEDSVRAMKALEEATVRLIVRRHPTRHGRRRGKR
jgi:integrase